MLTSLPVAGGETFSEKHQNYVNTIHFEHSRWKPTNPLQRITNPLQRITDPL